jgi:hypothetical protein
MSKRVFTHREELLKYLVDGVGQLVCVNINAHSIEVCFMNGDPSTEYDITLYRCPLPEALSLLVHGQEMTLLDLMRRPLTDAIYVYATLI